MIPQADTPLDIVARITSKHSLKVPTKPGQLHITVATVAIRNGWLFIGFD